MQWQDNKRFCLIYPFVLNVEGGYVSPERAKAIGDKGGATNHGVAYNYHAGRLKNYGIYSPHDMVKLNQEQAIDFYYQYFWIPSQADEIPDYRLAFAYFDMAVNSGIEAADAALLKLPDQRFWYYKGDDQNEWYFWPLTVYFLGTRLFAYTSYRQWTDFGKGWTNRMGKIQQAYWKMRHYQP